MMNSMKSILMMGLAMWIGVYPAHANPPGPDDPCEMGDEDLPGSSDEGSIPDGVFVFECLVDEEFSGSTGTASFRQKTPIALSGPINATLDVTGINVTSSSPELGTITSTLDPSRQAGETTIISNGAERFPATGELRFFANATIASKPGTFASRTELVLFSDNLISILPFAGETFTLREDTEFYDITNPEVTAFTLKAGSTSVTVDGFVGGDVIITE